MSMTSYDLSAPPPPVWTAPHEGEQDKWLSLQSVSVPLLNRP
jgi:hypothetical protein